MSENVETTEAATTEESAPTEKTFTQEEVNSLLAAEKRKVRSQFEDYDDFKERAEKAAELESKLSESVARADAAELSTRRLSVALDKGVPADLLTGSTAEELEEHAEKLLSFRGAAAPAKRETNSSGNTNAPTGMDVYERAAQALRKN